MPSVHWQLRPSLARQARVRSRTLFCRTNNGNAASVCGTGWLVFDRRDVQASVTSLASVKGKANTRIFKRANCAIIRGVSS